jgi:hypothetical protein
MEALMGIANSKDEYSFQKMKEAIEKTGTFIDNFIGSNRRS